MAPAESAEYTSTADGTSLLAARMILRGKPEFPEPSRILLIQPRRIGDVLLCTPAIRALSRRFPAAPIDFIAEEPAHEGLLGHPQIDRLLIPRRDNRVQTLWEFVRRLREVRYDWAIDFFSNPRSAQFAWLSGARVRVGLDRRGRRWAYTHHVVEQEADRDAYAVDLRLDTLERMGVPAAGRELEIFSDCAEPAEARRAAEAVAQLSGSAAIVAMATGSANPAKRYPADLAALTIELLRNSGLAVVLTSGPGEAGMADEIAGHLETPVARLSEARVPTLAALYRRISIYVGPDSGPKHVAVACGLPTVTIFGPGRPNNWNDRLNARNIVLLAPCELRPHCSESECARRQCLRKIAPEQVAAAVRQLLDQAYK